jgi:transposase
VPLRDALAAALEANERLAAGGGVAGGERAAWLQAEQAAELERVRADLAVLQRMVFGRSSERARAEPSAGTASLTH